MCLFSWCWLPETNQWSYEGYRDSYYLQQRWIFSNGFLRSSTTWKTFGKCRMYVYNICWMHGTILNDCSFIFISREFSLTFIFFLLYCSSTKQTNKRQLNGRCQYFAPFRFEISQFEKERMRSFYFQRCWFHSDTFLWHVRYVIYCINFLSKRFLSILIYWLLHSVWFTSIYDVRFTNKNKTHLTIFCLIACNNKI